MGLRSLFQRKPATTAPALTAPAGTVQDEPLSPELQKELQAAWAELTEAAKNSGVINFHACTRNGRSWTDDLAAVRAVAATLREFPSTDTQQPT